MRWTPPDRRKWKLAGIDLPEPMRLELAQELMKRREAAKE
jgi:hypothetical protein